MTYPIFLTSPWTPFFGYWEGVKLFGLPVSRGWIGAITPKTGAIMSDWKNLLWDATCSFCCLCHHCARPPVLHLPTPHVPSTHSLHNYLIKIPCLLLNQIKLFTFCVTGTISSICKCLRGIGFWRRLIVPTDRSPITSCFLKILIEPSISKQYSYKVFARDEC